MLLSISILQHIEVQLRRLRRGRIHQIAMMRGVRRVGGVRVVRVQQGRGALPHHAHYARRRHRVVRGR